MRRHTLALALAGLASVALASCVPADAAPGADNVWIEVRIRHSRFLPSTLEIPRRKLVTLVFRNEDPIDHEWIVGTEDVHAHHRIGTEPIHASRPTEISIPALEARQTTVVFDRPVTLRFVCHLPGHEAYGMVGTLRVR